MNHKKSVVNEDDGDPIIKFLNVFTEENKKSPQDSALEMIKVQEQGKIDIETKQLKISLKIKEMEFEILKAQHNI